MLDFSRKNRADFLIEFLGYCLLGTLIGVFLGMIPGFHINNFLPFMMLAPFSNDQFFFLIIAMSMGFIFSFYFPSTLLGVPNEDTALSVLPAHKMVQNGKAYNSLILSFIGSLSALVFSLVLLIFFIIFLPIIFPSVEFLVPWILAAVIVLFVLKQKKALIIILLTSALGFMTINFNLILPLLTGFFGLSTLLISFSENSVLPEQRLEFNPKISFFTILHTSFLASFLGSIFNLLPAVSSSITASIGKVFGRLKIEEFIVFIASINTTYMIFSLITFYLIGKTRSGSAVFLSQIIGNQSIFHMIGVAIFTGSLACIICIILAPKVLSFYYKINYRATTLVAIIFLIITNLIFTGFFGLMVLFASTSIGILCNYLKVARITCMSALIVPVIFVLI